MNNTLKIYDLLGKDPDLGNYSDKDRWSKYIAWSNKLDKACWSKTRTDTHGRVYINYWWKKNRAYWSNRQENMFKKRPKHNYSVRLSDCFDIF